MSEDIRRYEVEPRKRMSGMCLSMDLTSFWGGEKLGRSIQFTLSNGSYIALSEKQLRDLVGVISRHFDDFIPEVTLTVMENGYPAKEIS